MADGVGRRAILDLPSILPAVSGLLSFPNPVNEKAARTVAAVVAVTAIAALASGWYWLVFPLAYGFVARALTGPTLSPLGRAAMWVARRHLGEARLVAGPPKRFAQSVGAVFTVAGAAFLVAGWDSGAIATLAIIAVFATLESVFALCVGCKVFTLLMRVGVIPERICMECADIGLRSARRSA